MKKTRKLLATLLTFALLFGTTLSVRAEGATYTISYEDNHITGITIGQELTGGSTITVKDDVSNNDYYMNIFDSTTPLFCDRKSCTLPTENNYKVFSVGHSESLKRYIIFLEIITPDPSDDPSPSEPSSPSTEPAVPESKPHVHSYSWVTVQDATAEQDGIEEYRCSCGDVQQTIPINNDMVVYESFANELEKQIKTAEEGATLKLDMNAWHSVPSFLMERIISCGRDVELTYKYQGVLYDITIKAGQGQNLNIPWYGPLLMNSLYGN